MVLATTALAAAYTPERSIDGLAHWLDEASRFVEIDGMRVHYRREGAAGRPTLVLLHGTGASLHTWDGWVSARVLIDPRRRARHRPRAPRARPIEEAPARTAADAAAFLDAVLAD